MREERLAKLRSLLDTTVHSAREILDLAQAARAEVFLTQVEEGPPGRVLEAARSQPLRRPELV